MEENVYSQKIHQNVRILRNVWMCASLDNKMHSWTRMCILERECAFNSSECAHPETIKCMLEQESEEINKYFFLFISRRSARGGQVLVPQDRQQNTAHTMLQVRGGSKTGSVRRNVETTTTKIGCMCPYPNIVCAGFCWRSSFSGIS